MHCMRVYIDDMRYDHSPYIYFYNCEKISHVFSFLIIHPRLDLQLYYYLVLGHHHLSTQGQLFVPKTKSRAF